MRQEVKWSRRAVLGGTAAAFTLGGRRAEADARLLGEIGAFAAPGSPWDKQWDHFKRETAARGIAFNYNTRGELGNEETMIRALRRGRISIGGFSLQGLSDLIPEIAVAMVPYLFQSSEEVDYVYDNHLAALFEPLFAEKGMRVLNWVEVGWSNLYAKKPLPLPAEARGQKLRGSPNIAAQAFLRAIGADSVAIGTTDILPALQTGMIDGGISATSFYFTSGLMNYAPHLTLTRHAFDTGANTADLRWWGRLSSADQEAVLASLMPSQAARALVRETDRAALAELQAREGVYVHELSEEQRAAWASAGEIASQEIVRQVRGKAEAIYTAIQNAKAEFKSKTVR
jgi:TRAP-type C4-dicarboxylate transport system substrate-binding protein